MNRSTTILRSFSADQLHTALGDVGGPARPDYLADIVAAAGRTRQRPGLTFPERWQPTDVPVRRRGVPRTAVLLATLLLLGLLAAAGVYIGSQLTRRVDLGIFEPVAGRIVYGSEQGIYGIEDGIWGLDPHDPDPATTVQLTSEPGTPLGWSSDGTRLLIQMGNDTLLVLHADGSETHVTKQPWGLKGATISPDGSRVAFAGLTQEEGEHGGLFAVDADGGPAELLRGSQDHILRFPTFSPDGTQIAFVDDNIDTSHSVWVMNADGTDALQIWNAEGFGPGHVRGLSWSPAGDRIALALANFGREDGIYTLAPDGADLRQVITSGDNPPYWSPDGSRIVYTTGCMSRDADDLGHGCVWVIADADGSNVQRFSDGTAGPWHPGEPSPSEPTVAPTSTPAAVAGPAYCGSQTREVRARIPVGDGILGDAGTVLGCSRDGTRLLIKKGLAGNLFVLDADGSETQVSEALSGSDVVGSFRPTGATISPDGSRVVFAGKTQRGRGCHDGALFVVDADGGPAELLWKSQRDGIVRDPMFSPDGTQIAFADGYCDSDQSVWVMNADGSDPHRIVGPIGAGHVKGLAWSPAGDRIALALDAEIHTFAADGSGFTSAADATVFCWPGRRCY